MNARPPSDVVSRWVVSVSLCALLACAAGADLIEASDQARAETGVFFYDVVESLLASSVAADATGEAIEVDLLDARGALVGVAVVFEDGRVLAPDQASLGEEARATLREDLAVTFFPNAFRSCPSCHVTGVGGAYL